MGLHRVKGRGLGVLWIDYDHDGWPDLFIACDLSPNLLLHNFHGRRFEEVGLQQGVAYGADAAVLSGMGVSAADYDHIGWESLVVTNFSGQPNSLYRAAGNGSFEDATYSSGVGSASMDFLAFGVEFFDFDNDGYADIVTGNGHIDPFISETAPNPNTTYKERKILFRNMGNGTFQDDLDDLGDMAEPRVTRGLATGDYDNDGRVDVLDNSQNMPAALYHNQARGGHFVILRLEGTRSNRDGAGAKVILEASGQRVLAEVRDGSSYASTSDRRVHFGLGDARSVERLTIHWPSGIVQTFRHIPGDRFYLLREGAGIAPDPRIR